MTDIVLDDVSSGFNLSVINDNFEVVKDVINDDLLHLEGGNNVMRQALDMNSRRILNLPQPSSSSEPARLADLQAVISGGIDDASLINYTASGTGATQRTVKGSLDDLFVNIKNFGAVGDFVTDDAEAIQDAIDEASQTGKFVFVPAGTYKLIPATGKTWEGAGTMLCALIMKSNMHILAEPGAVFKIDDDISSDASPTQMAMFFTNEVLSNVSIDNLILDMNGANNLISPNRGVGTYNRYNQAHIHVTGTPGGVAARIDNVRLRNCTFRNTPGVTCIGMQQTNTSGLQLSDNWKVIDCRFEENGIDSDDHSSIFGWAENVEIAGCNASNTTMYDGTGANVFYECHGANQHIHDNIVENYNQFSWCATNNTSDTQNVVYHDNVAKVRENGTAFYRLTTSTGLLRKIKIHHDIYNLTDDATAAPLKYGVLLSGGFADAVVSDVEVSNVLVTKVGTTYPSAAIGIGAAANIAGQKHTRIKVRNCDSLGVNFGVFLNTNATNGLGELEVTGGNLQTAPTATFTSGDGLHVNLSGSNTIDTLVVGGIHFDGSNNGMHRGIYLEQGTITDLHLRPCTYQGVLTANYSEGSTTITRKHGTFPMLAHTPVLKAAGVAVTVGNATQDAYYKKRDEECSYRARFVVGSTTSFGAGGSLSFDLPFTAATAGSKYIGFATIIDSATGTRYMHQVFVDGTGSTAQLQKDGGTLITNADPLALGTGDEVYIDVVFRVSD